MPDRTVILYTFSKKFAMTGWRLGAGIVPASLSNYFGTLNTNIESCTAHFVQYGGLAGLEGDQSEVAAIVDTLRGRRDAAYDVLSTIPGVKLAKPESTFYLFPDVTETMQRVGATSLADFAEQALHQTGCSFCTRNHFGRPLPGETTQFVRFAYSGISEDRIREGLGTLKGWVESK